MNLAFSSPISVSLRGNTRTSSSTLRSRAPRAVLDESPVATAVRPVAPKWSPSSWRSRRVGQQPEYPDAAHLRQVEDNLCKMPSLVAPGELSSLKRQMAEACKGNGFVLQGGDCAEDLNESASGIKDTIRSLFKMAVVLMWGAQQPVIKIGRMAGQYGKPRSLPTETINGVTLPVYRGEVSFPHCLIFIMNFFMTASWRRTLIFTLTTQ